MQNFMLPSFKLKTKKYFRLSVFIFFVFIISVPASRLFAQGSVTKKAIQSEEMNHFQDASRIYKGLFEKGNREASLRAARNLWRAGKPEDALKLFEFADSLGIISDHENLFAFFECLKSVKRYADADGLVKSRISEYAAYPEFSLQLDKLNYYSKLSSYTGAKLELLPVNSGYSDISPTLYNGWLYFVSTRPSPGFHSVHRINMQPFYNLYGSPVQNMTAEVASPSGDFGKTEGKIKLGDLSAASLPKGVNKKYHDGPVFVAPSGNMMLFTTNWSDEKSNSKNSKGINLRIYYSVRNASKWSQPVSLPGNSFAYSNQHAFWEEKSSTLFFASNRPGGFGSYDIWKTTMKSDGSWSEAENLGPAVNTSKNEVFPALAPDGKLIFASNGWPGLGGLDLFISSGSGVAYPLPGQQNLNRPLNLLAGINSEKDDFGMVFTGAGEGYMVSNRAGGKGDDDIYKFTFPYELNEITAYNLVESGVEILLSSEKSSVPIGEITVNQKRDDIVKQTILKNGESISCLAGDVLTIEVPGFSSEVVQMTPERMASGKISMPLRLTVSDLKKNPASGNAGRVPAKDGGVASSPENVFAAGKPFRRISENSGSSYSGNQLVKSGASVVSYSASVNTYPPLYFRYRLNEIHPTSFKVLNAIISDMNQNPEMKVEIYSYSGCASESASGLRLSQKRLHSVIEYLRKKISNPDRLIRPDFSDSEFVSNCLYNNDLHSDCSEIQSSHSSIGGFLIFRVR
jgi:hypothetical protein